MSEIIESILEHVKNRTKSASIGTFIFFWCSWHWQGLYTTLFVSQDLIYAKYGILKNEYVYDKHYFGLHGLGDWRFYMGILVPALLTYLFIFYIPKFIMISFYKKEQWFKVEKRIIKSVEETRLNKAIKSENEAKTKALQAEADRLKKLKNVEDDSPEVIWAKELKMIDEAKRRYLEDLFKVIYSFRGQIGGTTRIGADALRYVDSSGIASITNKGTTIELTEKGKYFARNFDNVEDNV